MKEHDLIKRVKNNDDDAYKELVENYRNMIYSIINKFSLRHQHIKLSKEDLFQEACISLLEACKTFDSSKNTKFSTFAYRVIYCHLAREVCKIIKVIQNEVCFYDNDENFNTIYFVRDNEFTYSAQYARSNFFESIDFLSFEDKTILQMRIDNYSYKEIADKLNITTKRVDNRLNKLRKKWKNGDIKKY